MKKYAEALQYYSAAFNMALNERRAKKFIDTLKVWMGKAAWGLGEKDTAAQIYTVSAFSCLLLNSPLANHTIMY